MNRARPLSELVRMIPSEVSRTDGGNCPACDQRVIASDYETYGYGSLRLRCPHCRVLSPIARVTEPPAEPNIDPERAAAYKTRQAEKSAQYRERRRAAGLDVHYKSCPICGHRFATTSARRKACGAKCAKRLATRTFLTNRRAA